MVTNENNSSAAGGGLPPTPPRGQAARPSPGLVNSGISRHDNVYSQLTGTITINQNGIRAKRNSIIPPFGKHHSCGRSDIYGFSSAARSRMEDCLQQLDWEILKAPSKLSRLSRAAFLTLTYPPGYSNNWKTWKRDLDAFRKHLLRDYLSATSVIWKLENQEKRCIREGADFVPHFHLVIDFKRIEHLSAFRKWVSHIWYLVVGSNNPKHLKSGTQVIPIYGETSKLRAYLSKYLSKTFKCEARTGRVWGKWNAFALAPSTTHSNVPWVSLTRRIRNYGGRYSPHLASIHARKTMGFRVTGENLQKILVDIVGGNNGAETNERPPTV